MASRVFLYVIGLSVALLFTLIFYQTPKITVTLPEFNFQSIRTSSSSTITLPSNDSKTAPRATRRFALFSSSIHSKLRSYIFYAPITAAAWQRLGYEAIVVFTGDFTARSNASLSPQLHLSRKLLQRLGVRTIDFQCDMSYSVKMSQLVRIFGGFLPDTFLNDTDYILTTDSDIIPMQRPEYEVPVGADGFIYNAFCCGSFERRNKTYQMYPMSHICLPKQIWRDMFLESVRRKELLQAKPPSLNATLLSAQAPFSFETVSVYSRHEFGALYDGNMTKGDAAWYMDQIYVSILLNEYAKSHPTLKIDKHEKKSRRLDSSLPYGMWDPQRLQSYGDAHLMHDEIFDSIQYVPIRKLLFFLFNSSLATEFHLYYKQFTLTLQDLPENQQ